MKDEVLINGGHDGRAQVQVHRVKRKGWNKRRRTTFLKALTETCNVRLATERAGMGYTGIYAVRHRDPAFAALWDEALAIGYDRLEALLLQRALEGINDIDVAALVDSDADDTETPATAKAKDDDGGEAGDAVATVPGSGFRASLGRHEVQLALAMLSRRGAKDGLRSRGRKAMGSDEVDALLTKKLDALARRRANT